MMISLPQMKQETKGRHKTLSTPRDRNTQKVDGNTQKAHLSLHSSYVLLCLKV